MLPMGIDGIDRAAGIFLPSHKLADPKGKAIGWLSDSGKNYYL